MSKSNRSSRKAADFCNAIYHKGLATGATVDQVLHEIASLFDSYGCVLWAVQPEAITTGDSRLFVLASSFPSTAPFAMYDLAVVNSASGQALTGKTAICEHDVRQSGGHTPAIEFFDQHNIGPMLVVPLAFDDGANGTLNLYRQRDAADFDCIEDAPNLMAVAEAFQGLYSSMCSRNGFDLVTRIETILQKPDTLHDSIGASSVVATDAVKACCIAVGKAFRSLEVSVFLEDRTKQPNVFPLRATTWSDWCEQDGGQLIYTADMTKGLTGWVLAQAQPVHLFDLVNFERDRVNIDKQYPGLTWHRSASFLSAVRARLGLPERSIMPPVSFMAAPILAGTNVLGALRCCAAERGPYYYSTNELRLLTTVAMLIGHYWSQRVSRKTVELDNRLLRYVVEKVGHLNKAVQKRIAKSIQSSSSGTPGLFDLALNTMDLSIAEIDGYAVRLVRSAREPSVIALQKGRVFARTITPDARRPQREQRRQAAVLASSNAQQDSPVVWKKSDVPMDYPELGPGGGGITARVVADGKLQALFDFVAEDATRFDAQDETLCSLLADQLGLYFELDEQIGKLNKTRDALEKNLQESRKMEKQRRRALVDLAHQLKNPLEQAKIKSEIIVTSMRDGTAPKSNLELRGLCRRAWRVANGMRFLAELQDGRSVTTKRAVTNSDSLVRLLAELMEDASLLSESYRNISSRVQRKTFLEIDLLNIKIDVALIEQALINVIDNAFKYAYSNTVVEAYGTRTGSGRFCINIKNVGLAIKSNETALCKQREWRSELAESVTSEGSGIGLWIVDEIMKAHDGYLEIVPTTESNHTEVKLIF